jgi:hypothetical protein
MRPVPTVYASLVLGLVLTAAPGCGSKPDAEPQRDAELDRLRALGYVGFTDQQVDPDADSVTHYDPERSAPGYNLISNRDLTSAQLFDARGVVVREWKDPGANHWSNAELQSNGDLLVTGSEQVDTKGSNFLLRMSWDGEVVWRSEINAHHDAEIRPDGLVATLTFNFRRIPEIDAEHEVKDHGVALLTPDGELIEEHSLYDLLCGDPSQFKCEKVPPKTAAGVTFIDLLHTNSLEFMHRPELEGRHPLYASSNVLVSIRHQDTIAVFDLEAGKLVWSWGRGEISGQHDATVLANGNILLFDNGVGLDRSRILEIDPLSKEIVWEYQAENPSDFFSLRKGSNRPSR